jgi:hypothetical protein
MSYIDNFLSLRVGGKAKRVYGGWKPAWWRRGDERRNWTAVLSHETCLTGGVRRSRIKNCSKYRRTHSETRFLVAVVVKAVFRGVVEGASDQQHLTHSFQGWKTKAPEQVKRTDKNEKMPELCGGLAAQIKSRAIDKEEIGKEERETVEWVVASEGCWPMYNQDMPSSHPLTGLDRCSLSQGSGLANCPNTGQQIGHHKG